jgi:hypothetical protein
MTDIRDIYPIDEQTWRVTPEAARLRLEDDVRELQRQLATLRGHYDAAMMYVAYKDPIVAQIFREAEGGAE